MKKFNYKLNNLTIAFVVLGFCLSILAIIFSILKLANLANLISVNPLLDVITIIIALFICFFLLIVCLLKYHVSPKGVTLTLGFFPLKKYSLPPKDISLVIYKTKQNTLLIVKDTTPEILIGVAINIKPKEYNSFVQALIDNKISFDYMEDVD